MLRSIKFYHDHFTELDQNLDQNHLHSQAFRGWLKFCHHELESQFLSFNRAAQEQLMARTLLRLKNSLEASAFNVRALVY